MHIVKESMDIISKDSLVYPYVRINHLRINNLFRPIWSKYLKPKPGQVKKSCPGWVPEKNIKVVHIKLKLDWNKAKQGRLNPIPRSIYNI